VMIDPQGRFFSNETGRYRISQPILEVGVQTAMAQVGWRQDKFVARGGLYAW
jgi:radical S-adenosyl methionine domain-containing protein 2